MLDVAAIDEQVDQLAPDEQFGGRQHRTEHGEREREPQLAGRRGVDQPDGEPNRGDRPSPPRAAPVVLVLGVAHRFRMSHGMQHYG